MSEERDGERVTDRNQTLLLLDGLIQRDQFGYQLGSFPENLNVTLRNGNATEEIDSFYFYQTEQFTVLLLLFVMIVVGNIAVLIGLLWGKRRKTRMDFFIKQLAFAARGDPSFPDARLQAGRITPSKQEMTKQADALILERMQTKMRFLEDSNTVVQTRNQNLIAENKVLTSQLEDERSDVKILGKRMESLREELESEKSRVAEMKIAAMQRKNMPQVEANGTSTTNFVSRTDRGVQIWAVCMGCQRKLESCEKQPPIVVITKSELELLEKDMQTLRDTIIAREEAWDKAMEREQNYRQQLTRLTTETITARHLSETRYEELQTLSKTLLEKESELKSHQKDNQCLNKLIVKLYNGHQSCRGQDESKKSNVLADINEKDQKFIEEIVRRVSSAKSKQKPKAKSARSEKNANCSAYQTTSRDKSARPAKDQTGLSRDVKR